MHMKHNNIGFLTRNTGWTWMVLWGAIKWNQGDKFSSTLEELWMQNTVLMICMNVWMISYSVSFLFFSWKKARAELSQNESGSVQRALWNQRENR